MRAWLFWISGNASPLPPLSPEDSEPFRTLLITTGGRRADTLTPRPSPLFVYFALFFTLPFHRFVGIPYSLIAPQQRQVARGQRGGSCLLQAAQLIYAERVLPGCNPWAAWARGGTNWLSERQRGKGAAIQWRVEPTPVRTRLALSAVYRAGLPDVAICR